MLFLQDHLKDIYSFSSELTVFGRTDTFFIKVDRLNIGIMYIIYDLNVLLMYFQSIIIVLLNNATIKKPNFINLLGLRRFIVYSDGR